MSASPTPVDLPPAVASWRDQLERLSPHASPCRYMPPVRWAAVREAAIDFCDRLGADALALGWTDRQLFGVHPAHGTLRVDYCGAVMVAGKRATGVHADRVAFERTG
ncbi:hypothetical protein QO001_000840 [Methylobacterium brachiatum]|jgi:hypothetical protein|uniref:Uncharacterized protein n=1 Tax=Methylobacterium brachiatum TaxID=269660 RepID=A0AAJ1WUD8_9HYPH|nr:hypothetical protein [Methylobacterium brachiatum]MDQ0541932.1 hypothetical protein [Methylobacterium brachiatum]